MEGGWFDEEALEAERFDADMEQAELERLGRRASDLKRRGECPHGSWVGYAVNPTTGKPYYPEQEGLVGEQVRCTDGCAQVFEDGDAIMRAHQEVMGL